MTDDLAILYERLLEGNFYDDHDEATRLLGVLRRHLDALAIEAQRAATLGAVHESAGPQGQRQGDSA